MISFKFKFLLNIKFRKMFLDEKKIHVRRCLPANRRLFLDFGSFLSEVTIIVVSTSKSDLYLVGLNNQRMIYV